MIIFQKIDLKHIWINALKYDWYYDRDDDMFSLYREWEEGDKIRSEEIIINDFGMYDYQESQGNLIGYYDYSPDGSSSGHACEEYALDMRDISIPIDDYAQVLKQNIDTAGWKSNVEIIRL